LTAIPHISFLQLSSLDEPSRLRASMVASIIFHAVVLFGITFTLPTPKFDNAKAALEVVLVNTKTKSRPDKADALAQHNLDGGGNTDADRHASTPFPFLAENQQISNMAAAKKRQQQLEEEQKKLMTQAKAKQSVAQATVRPEQIEAPADKPDATEMMNSALSWARDLARVEKQIEIYEKRPKRAFVGSKTEEFRFARYIEDWRSKVERIGTLNFPAEARRKKIFGELKLTVAIKADGSLERVEIDRSSGKKVLDEAALRIVRMGAPYAALPADILKDADILHITRTWMFTSTDELVTK